MNKGNKNKKKKDIFYGLVIVSTLIISIIGSSLAYFSYKTGSGENKVRAKSAMLNVRYEDGQQVTAQADLLIPSTLDVVKKVYQAHINNGEVDNTKNICIDDNNRQVCSVYRFSIISDINNEVYAILNTENNEFNYLSYAVYDVTNNTWLVLNGNNEYLNLEKCTNNNEVSSDDCYTGSGEGKIFSEKNPKAINSIFGYNNNGNLKNKTVTNIEHTYDLVFFIKENDTNQNVDRGKKYQGSIVAMITDDIGTVLTGK